MVSSELIHNPYLLQTSVKFNGQTPKINSQIEKYLNQTLKDWVHMVPLIFRDEMNGFDFDLNFTGTKPDFAEVERAFREAGVSSDKVRLFLKNELEDADIKSVEIDELLHWLSEYRNRKFDYDTFRANNTNLFDSTYPYILLRGNISEPINAQIGIEEVNNADEIKNTLLTDTPILFYVEENSMEQFRVDLAEILKRKDVSHKQIFFMFHPSVNAEQTKRILIDLGIETPQVVSSVSDELVLVYLRNYPVTEYIRQAIKLFESTVTGISDQLEVENRESKLVNAEIHARIENLERIITGLKSADEYFAERDNYSTPSKLWAVQSELSEQIYRWRNRKTKIIGECESEVAAEEYEAYLKNYYSEFLTKLQEECNKACTEIAKNFKDRYTVQDFNKEYMPTDIAYVAPIIPDIPELASKFTSLRQVSFEEPKTDLLSVFLKSPSKEDKSPVCVVTCYYDEWRGKALEILMTIADRYIATLTDALRNYYNELAEEYHVHLTELIATQTKNKEKVSSQLSDDERRLQDDNDWLSEFKDKLSHIERG